MSLKLSEAENKLLDEILKIEDDNEPSNPYCVEDEDKFEMIRKESKVRVDAVLGDTKNPINP